MLQWTRSCFRLALFFQTLGAGLLFGDPHQPGQRVERQPSLPQRRKQSAHERLVCGGVERDGGSASLAIVARQFDAVHDCILHARQLRDVVSHLARADILPFPAERVAQPIVKQDPSVGIVTEEIAHAMEDVAFREHVPQQLTLRRIDIPQILRQQSPIFDAPNCFARLSKRCLDAEPSLGIAVDFFSQRIDLDNESIALHPSSQRPRKAQLPRRRRTPAVVVELRKALRAPVEFPDLRNIEAFPELLPDLTTQSVARGNNALVLFIVRGRWS